MPLRNSLKMSDQPIFAMLLALFAALWFPTTTPTPLMKVTQAYQQSENETGYLRDDKQANQSDTDTTEDASFQHSGNNLTTDGPLNFYTDNGKYFSLVRTGNPNEQNSKQNRKDNRSSVNSAQDIKPFAGKITLHSYLMHECLKTSGQWQYRTLSMEIFVKHTPLKSIYYISDTNAFKLQCEVEIIVPKDMVVKVQVVNLTSICDPVRRLHVVDSSRLDTVLDVCQSTTIAGEFSLSHRVTSKITVNQFLKSGFLQTPRWDGQVHYPHSMNSKVVITVPTHHIIMLSFVSIQMGLPSDCRDDYLKIYKERSKKRVLALLYVDVVCGIYGPAPEKYNTTALRFSFVSSTRRQDTGFRAFFSFHNASATPQKTSEGFWNCSVPYWSDFRQHFPCNLESDCLHSEDEVECPYITDNCGKGVITAGHRCYVLLKQTAGYREMNEMCKARGGYLASLNTQQEWLDVWHVLQQGCWNSILMGLQPAPTVWPNMYLNSFYWADGAVAYYRRITVLSEPRGEMCVYMLDHWKDMELGADDCQHNDIHMLCEIDEGLNRDIPMINHIKPPTKRSSDKHNVTVCPHGHMTHDFLACDVDSACWADHTSSSAACYAPLASLPPHYICEASVGSVPYTLVCNHRQDCSDGSDENLCVFPACLAGLFRCENGQCVSLDSACDGQDICLDGSHEQLCVNTQYKRSQLKPSPAIIYMDQTGKLVVDGKISADALRGSAWCPETHFQCNMNDYYCLPVYLRCNHVYDCPDHEDEAGCHSNTCPGFYRCRSTRICIHPDHMCDGLFQCPQHDDELLCEFRCPHNCTCHGLALTCASPFPADGTPDLRYLDAHGTLMTFSDLVNNIMLIHLSLAKCQLTFLPPVTFPNLHSLDLSGNWLQSFNGSHLSGSPRLQVLSLSSNPLHIFYTATDQDSLFVVRTLDLSSTVFQTFDVSNFTMFYNLRELNLSGSGVERVLGKGFQLLSQLEVLDVRGCSMSEFPRGIMDKLEELRLVFADNYKLCCPATLPVGFRLSGCNAPSDEVSSCDTLLRSDFFRMFLYVFAAMALIGNAGSLVYRIIINRAKHKQGFTFFVTHLSASDLLMGTYLTIIGVADSMYRGDYLWQDVTWRNSSLCKVAGFLSLLSCEVSAFIICLITVDRFLVLRFPFDNFHFRKTSAQTACLMAWLTGLAIALIPLLPLTSHWEFYQQNSICIPLPVTRRYFKGLAYSFGVMIILNSVLFVLIAVGQAFIYHSIRLNSISMADSSKTSSKDLTIARRLITIAMSDFLCWFPIGFLGLLASQDMAIPGEVSVGLAIFVLPLNSALNPFLYTMNVIREKRRLAQFKKLQLLFQSQIQNKHTQVAHHGH